MASKYDLTAIEVNRLVNKPALGRQKPKRNGAHWLGLGKYKNFTLAEARQRARQYRQNGINSLEAKRKQITADKIKAAKKITFGECAKAYIAAHEPTWKNDKHTTQWHTVFKGSKRAPAVTAAINDLPVGEIDTKLALKVLEPIWTRTPGTANRLLRTAPLR